MRKRFLAAAVAAAAFVPTLAAAQMTCEERSARRAGGTALGAVTGALLGSAVAGHGHKGTGAVVGGVTGAIVGNQLSKGPKDCAHAYGWYDNAGRWHANRVDEKVAYGYYDRTGAWVDGRPDGSYDSRGVWTPNAAAEGASAANVSRDRPLDVDARIAQLDQWIDRSRDSGGLTDREARDARDALEAIRRDARDRRADGQLSDHDEALLQERLDRLGAQVRYDGRG
jgi:uncharacterized protein YcfJ